MSFFRKKKKSTTSSTTTTAEKKVDENNVRVGSSKALDDSKIKSMTKVTTSLPSSLEEGETTEDNEIFDRRAYKATSAKRSNINQDDRNSTTDDDDATIATATATLTATATAAASLRTGARSYGNARENTEGFYNARIVVKDWQFNRDTITVPSGTMVVFSVDSKERSMVELTINITNKQGHIVDHSECLTAGQLWEYFATDVGEYSFQDQDDEELKGTIIVVEGDQSTKFASQ